MRPAQGAALVDALLEEGQAHLFAGWPPAGEADDAKRKLLDQLLHLDKNYAGGLRAYIKNARKLLHDSKEGACPPPPPAFSSNSEPWLAVTTVFNWQFCSHATCCHHDCW